MGGACSAYGDRRSVYRLSMGNLMDRDHLEEPGVNSRIILRWILRRWDVSLWTGWSWLRIGRGDWHL